MKTYFPSSISYFSFSLMTESRVWLVSRPGCQMRNDEKYEMSFGKSVRYLLRATGHPAVCCLPPGHSHPHSMLRS